MIYVILGGIGSGKTAFMTWFLHGKFDDGYDIYANYELYGIDYYNLRDIHDMDLIRENSDKSIVAIDEIDKAGLDSRHSGRNIEFTKYMLQSRKFARKSDVIVDTQLWSSIDLRVRGIVNYVFEPEIIATEKITEKPLALSVDFFDMQTRKYLEPLIVPLRFKFKHGYVDICDAYDTSEFIEELDHNTPKACAAEIRKYAFKGYNQQEIMTMLMTVEHPPHPRTRAEQLSKLIKIIDKGILKMSQVTGDKEDDKKYGHEK